MACGVVLVDADGREIARSRTRNLSDAGALLEGFEPAPEPGSEVWVDLSVPRSTPNTRMVETCRGRAFVIRRDEGDNAPPGENTSAVALRFLPPLDLWLDA